MKKQPEKVLAKKVADYLEIKYPNAIRRFDLAADMKMSVWQGARNKSLHGRHTRGYPDLFIAKPNRYYAGLFLELKADGNSPYKKDGTLKKNEHLQRQNAIHEILRNDGYCVKFVTGFQEAIDVIEEYMEDVV